MSRPNQNSIGPLLVRVAAVEERREGESRDRGREMGRLAVAMIVSLWVVPISILVNRIVPEPYMYEIFHIPQAQRYCRGDFKNWDPMITTPPGLYYLTLAYVASWFPSMWVINVASSISALCSTAVLRSVNGALAIICSVLVYELFIHLNPATGERKATVYAIVLALYPVNWFFTFLYYTDVASLTAVLAMYLASLRRRYWVSAMLGVLATLLRQTNVVWMAFVAATGAINYAEEIYGKYCAQRDVDEKMVNKKNILTNDRSLTRSALRRHRTNSSKPPELSISSLNKCSVFHSLGFLEEIVDSLFKLWQFKWEILILFSPFVVVFMAFVIFVIWNGSIVLGAKEAHVVSPHFPQMLYFGIVSAGAFAPVHISIHQAACLCRYFGQRKFSITFQASVALLIASVAVHFFSIAHPYLLADNRHYTFYIWRKLIQSHWTMKYLLVPFYVFSWFSIFSNLGEVQKKIWIFFFFGACGLVLVPAPLIEFRYYTIPIYFLILHYKSRDTSVWLAIGIVYVTVNFFTMAMFLFRPFKWSHESGFQRFIW